VVNDNLGERGPLSLCREHAAASLAGAFAAPRTDEPTNMRGVPCDDEAVTTPVRHLSIL
jgi:hypothetical protein